MTVSEVHFRVSATMTERGLRPERHMFHDLTGHVSVALCTHTAVTELLGADDPALETCPVCQLFRNVELGNVRVDRFDAGTDWFGM